MTCVREVPGSRLGLEKNILTAVFVVFRSLFRQMWNDCRLEKITALFWVITQWVVVISYRRIGTTYRSHVWGLKILNFLTLRMEPIACTETLVTNYHYSLRKNSEECSSQLLDGGSSKSRLQVTVVTLHSLLLRSLSYDSNLYSKIQKELFKYHKNENSNFARCPGSLLKFCTISQ
jgi:hypothetical protein